MSSQPNWKLPLILSISLFVLGAGAYWLEFKRKPQVEEAEQATKKIFDLKDQQVTNFQIFDGKQRFSLTCTELAVKTCKPGDNAKWLLESQEKLRGDDSNANALVSALNNLTVGSSFSLKDEPTEKRSTLLQEYGLDSAARTTARSVEVTTERGKVALTLGQTHPVGDTIYGLVSKDGKPDEETIYLVPAYFKANFEHDLTYWRDKKLFTISAQEVKKFELFSSKGRITGSKSAERWTLRSGADEAPGDNEAIEALLSGVTFMSAKGFADRKDIAGKSASASLSMDLDRPNSKDEKPVTIQIFPSAKGAAGRPEKLFATVSNLDSVYELEPVSQDRFSKSFRELRLAKLITSMERFTTKRLKFSGKGLGSDPLLLTQKAGKWIDSSPGAKPDLNGDRVQMFLDRMSGNRIQEFVPEKSLPSKPSNQEEADAGSILFELWDDKDNDGKNPALRQIRFWRAAGKIYARDILNPRPEAYVVDPLIGDSLPWSRDAFTKPSDPPPARPASSEPAAGAHDGHGH